MSLLGKAGPYTARASAALPPAGAFDADNPAVAVAELCAVELTITYTPGAGSSAGRVKFKLLSSGDNARFGQRTIDEGVTTVTGGQAVTDLDGGVKRLPAALGAGAESWSYQFTARACGWFKILCAEAGDTAHPGTVLVTAVVGP